MKKLFLLALTMMVTLCANALDPTDSQMWWGYYNGGSIEGLGTGRAETFDCALFVPENHNFVGGSTIKALRINFPTASNVSMLKIWISKTQPSNVDNSDYVQDIDISTLKDGYNDIELTTPYEVNNQAIYVGYSFTIKQAEYCIETGGEYVENSLFIRSSQSVTSWDVVTGYGCLAMNLLIDGGTYPNNYATAEKFGPAVVGIGKSVDIPVKITNGGKDPITTISYTISSGGTTSEELTKTISSLAYSSSAKINFTFDADATEGTVTKTLTITKVNGNANTATNNTATGNLTTVANLKTWPRNVLIEEFTTESCGYCPEAAAGLASFLSSNPDLASRVAVACHHAGFNTDWLTVDASKRYTWFYNDGGSTYAPAFMYDRHAADGKTAVVSRGNYQYWVEDRIAQTSYAGIDLSASFDSSKGKIYVKANCERGWDFSSTPVRITLFLTEDNIDAHSQSGAGGSFTHQHVLRAVNDTWGSELSWSNNKASYSYTFELDSSWKTEDLKVIAFLSGYDSSDATNCVVENTAVTIPTASTSAFVTISIGDKGKTTLTSAKALDFSGFEDLKAYVATGYESDGTIWLTRIKLVPAYTPILIKGTNNQIYDVPVIDKYEAYFKNMFQGSADEDLTISATTADGKYKNFYMSGGQFKPASNNYTLKAGKCYLQVPASFNPAVVGTDQLFKIADSGKSSYAPPVDIDLTNAEDGLKAYAATGYDPANSTIWLTRINKIQAGEGVILKGEPGKTYTLPAAEVQAYYGNMFVGNIGETITINETSDNGEWTNYYLASGSFKKVNGTRNIPSEKSYLQLPTSLLVSSARGKKNAGIDEWFMEELETETMLLGSIGGEDEDGTTRIDAIRQDNAQPDVYYNLQGQRVNNPKKGLYIKNGVKVVIK